MNWLLKLYPPGWRRRYGAELSELTAAQPFSINTAVDLLAGAVDAWLHPALIAPETPQTQGERMMSGRLLQLACTGYRPDIPAGNKRKSTVMNIGGTLVLTLPWLWAVWRTHGNAYVMALAPMMYIFPYLLSLRYTSMHGRSGQTQAVLICGLGAVLTAFFLGVAWIGTKI